MTDLDHQELLQAAKELIASRYQENRHHIAAAVRGESGTIYTGLHLDTYVGRASVCAEAVALGAALSAGEKKIRAIVSVRHPRPREELQDIKIVSPCGICREMLTDFAPDADILVSENGTIQAVRPVTLLPNKYRRLCKNTIPPGPTARIPRSLLYQRKTQWRLYGQALDWR